MADRKPDDSEHRHFTHGSSASTADMAVEGTPSHEDKPVDTPHSRPIEPPADLVEKVDHLAGKVEQAENRQEALIDESLEESFPASDPPSAKHVS